MIYTEREAKEKYCCQADQRNTCVGSACMAWRWLMYSPLGPLRQHEGGLLQRDGSIIDAKDISALHGYCGLTGERNIDY